MTLGECQANTMAALLLMPKPLLESTLRRHVRRQRIPIYGECVLLPSTKRYGRRTGCLLFSSAYPAEKV